MVAFILDEDYTVTCTSLGHQRNVQSQLSIIHIVIGIHWTQPYNVLYMVVVLKRYSRYSFQVSMTI